MFYRAAGGDRFVALADGRLLSLSETGYAGAHMFNLAEAGGTFLSGRAPYADYLLGSQNFTGRVTCLEVARVTP